MRNRRRKRKPKPEEVYEDPVEKKLKEIRQKNV